MKRVYNIISFLFVGACIVTVVLMCFIGFTFGGGFMSLQFLLVGIVIDIRNILIKK